MISDKCLNQYFAIIYCLTLFGAVILTYFKSHDLNACFWFLSHVTCHTSQVVIECIRAQYCARVMNNLQDCHLWHVTYSVSHPCKEMLSDEPHIVWDQWVCWRTVICHMSHTLCHMPLHSNIVKIYLEWARNPCPFWAFSVFSWFSMHSEWAQNTLGKKWWNCDFTRNTRNALGIHSELWGSVNCCVSCATNPGTCHKNAQWGK